MLKIVKALTLLSIFLMTVATCSAQQSGGYALVDIRRDTSGIEKRDPPGKVEAISDTSAKVMLKYGPMNGKYVSVASAHFWSAPPTILKAGEEVKFDLGLEVVLLEANWGAHLGEVTRLSIDTDRGGPIYSNYDAEKPIAIKGQVGENFPSHKKVSDSFTWKVPGGFKNLILVYSFAGDGKGKVYYTYEWQENPKPTVAPTLPKPGEDTVSENPDEEILEVPATTTTTPAGGNNGTTPSGNDASPADGHEQGAARFTVRAASRRVNAGQTIPLPIDILHPDGLANINVVVEYSQNVVEVVAKPSPGGIKQGRLFESNHSERGIVRLGLAGSEPLVTDGQLAIIPYKAIGTPGSRTKLKVSVTSANHSTGDALVPNIIHGEIEIVASGGDGSGDTDVDGEITAKDALDALKMSVKLLPVNLAADMDGDGVVTSNDARIILLKVVGK